MKQKFNPWKHCKVDPDSLKDNKYVNPPLPPPAGDDDAGSGAGEGGDAGSGNDDNDNPDVNIIDAKDFLILEDIVCYGSDGKIFEQHDKLEIAKDVMRSAKEFYDATKKKPKHVDFTPYQAISHFEKQKNGLFLPSYACQTVALVKLFQASVRKKQDGSFEIINQEFEKVLQQYKNYGPGHGYHNNNTIVDGAGGRIIHYPSKDDFTSHGGKKDINKARQKIERPFPTDMDRASSSLDDALKNAVKANYTQDLTGLKNPRILIDLAKYFGRTVWSYPADNSTCSAWLGCLNYYQFVIVSNLNLNVSGAARGVREP